MDAGSQAASPLSRPLEERQVGSQKAQRRSWGGAQLHIMLGCPSCHVLPGSFGVVRALCLELPINSSECPLSMPVPGPVQPAGRQGHTRLPWRGLVWTAQLGLAQKLLSRAGAWPRLLTAALGFAEDRLNDSWAEGGAEHKLYCQAGLQQRPGPLTLWPHGDGGLLEGPDHWHLAGFWKVPVNPAGSPVSHQPPAWPEQG